MTPHKWITQLTYGRPDNDRLTHKFHLGLTLSNGNELSLQDQVFRTFVSDRELRFYTKSVLGIMDICRVPAGEIPVFLTELLSYPAMSAFHHNYPEFMRGLLMQVCVAGDLVAAQVIMDFYQEYLLMGEADKAVRDPSGKFSQELTPLTQAAASGDAGMTDLLLRSGAPYNNAGYAVKLSGGSMWVPLYDAAILEKGTQANKLEVLKVLIRRGVPVPLTRIFEFNHPEKLLKVVYPDMTLRALGERVMMARAMTSSLSDAAALFVQSLSQEEVGAVPFSECQP